MSWFTFSTLNDSIWSSLMFLVFGDDSMLNSQCSICLPKKRNLVLELVYGEVTLDL